MLHRLILLLSAMSISCATIASGQSIPAGGASLFPADGLLALKPSGDQHELASVQTIKVTGQSFDRALRVSVKPGAKTEWNIQLKSAIDSSVRRGDVLLGHLWLRCNESMTGDGFVGFVFELGRDDFPKSIEQRLAAASEWRECFIPFTAQRDYAPGEGRVCLRLGYDRQTLDIAGLEILNYGRDVKYEDLPRTKITYTGRGASAKWRSEALERIEKIRKGDLTVRVVDASDQPNPNAKVHVTLKRHAFGFGSCVTVNQLLGSKPDDARYREIVEQNFNTAVFENDMKWPAMYENIPESTDRALDWLLERGIKVRGHNLVWPSWKWLPEQLRQYKNDPEDLRRRTAEHITQAVSHFKGKLYQWDVVNEPFTNFELMDLLGGRSVMLDWYKLARAADPACKLYLNDFGILDGSANNPHRKHFFDTLKWMKDSGGNLDGIGIQSHFGSDLPPPEQLIAVLDQFSQLGLPIESTELSLNIEDRQLQADYMRDYLIAFFSHPNVNGIMLWGFWEGRHWRPQAALFARDWTPRPQWNTWRDLVQKQWKTDTDVTTDEQGVARVRGFLGDYDVQVAGVTAKVKLPREGNEVKVVVK